MWRGVLAIGWAIAIAGGCEDGGSAQPPDASWECECGPSAFSCLDGRVRYWHGGDNVPCDQECTYDERSCSDGCDLEFFGGPFESRLEVFCRETPVAEEGDACGTRGCLPTRAVVQPHGSVLQTYLECAATTQRCVTAPPPLVPSYLEACPAAAAQFGAVDVEGHAYDVDTASPCLIAWDSELSASRHGRTIRCFGDWECPADSTCDDSIVSLPSGTRFEPVCRPGPRGAPLVDHLPAPR